MLHAGGDLFLLLADVALLLVGSLEALEVDLLGREADVVEGLLLELTLLAALAELVDLLVFVFSCLLLLFSDTVLGHLFVAEFIEVDVEAVSASVVGV